MPRIINFTIEVTDEEFANFLARFADRSTTTAAPAPAAATDDGDTGPVNTAAPAVDSAGVPWLESVHASTKTTVSDGTWRGKKGVTPEQRAAAEAPYRNAAPAAAPAPAAAMPTFTPPAPVGLPGMPPIVPVIPDVPVSMDDVVAAYQQLASVGKITPEQTGAVYAAAGVSNVNDLMTNETLRRNVIAELKKYA